MSRLPSESDAHIRPSGSEATQKGSQRSKEIEPVKLTGASSAFAGPGPAFDCLLPFGVLGLRGVLRGVFPLLLERADGAGAIAGLGARSLTGGRPAGRDAISFLKRDGFC